MAWVEMDGLNGVGDFKTGGSQGPVLAPGHLLEIGIGTESESELLVQQSVGLSASAVLRVWTEAGCK